MVPLGRGASNQKIFVQFKTAREIRSTGKKHKHSEFTGGKKGCFWSITPTAVKSP